MYPSLARRSEQDDDSPDLGLGSVSGYYVLVGLSSICAAIAIGAAGPLVAVILQHGRFDASAAGHATWAVRILLVGVPGAALLTLASRVLYARSQGARVALGFALGVVAELAVLYPALHQFGLNGLCLAMTCRLVRDGGGSRVGCQAETVQRDRSPGGPQRRNHDVCGPGRRLDGRLGASEPARGGTCAGVDAWRVVGVGNRVHFSFGADDSASVRMDRDPQTAHRKRVNCPRFVEACLPECIIFRWGSLTKVLELPRLRRQFSASNASPS